MNDDECGYTCVEYMRQHFVHLMQVELGLRRLQKCNWPLLGFSSAGYLSP